MTSIIGIVAVLVALLLARSAIRLWNRRIEAALENHLRRAREFAMRARADQRMADHPLQNDAFHIVPEAGRAGSEL